MSTHAPRGRGGRIDQPEPVDGTEGPDQGFTDGADFADDAELDAEAELDEEGPRDDEVSPANAWLTMIMFALFVGATIACYFIFDWH
ncbi:hypothetical protein CZ771_07725 [Actinomycetales bacterium JB111]|nr:hypothetical protein CZ771_07725 [Actinomycetales bacterium JB111]